MTMDIEKKMVERLQKSLDAIKECKEWGFGERVVTDIYIAQKQFVEDITGKAVVSSGWTVRLEER